MWRVWSTRRTCSSSRRSCRRLRPPTPSRIGRRAPATTRRHGGLSTTPSTGQAAMTPDVTSRLGTTLTTLTAWYTGLSCHPLVHVAYCCTNIGPTAWYISTILSVLSISFISLQVLSTRRQSSSWIRPSVFHVFASSSDPSSPPPKKIKYLPQHCPKCCTSCRFRQKFHTSYRASRGPELLLERYSLQR